MRRLRLQHGYVFVVVLTVMTVVAAMVTALAAYGASYYRAAQTDRMRQTGAAVRDSVVAYVEHNPDKCVGQAAMEPLALDISDLLPPKTSGSATITVERSGDAPCCRVHIELTSGRYGWADTFDLRPAVAKPATQPAALPTTR